VQGSGSSLKIESLALNSSVSTLGYSYGSGISLGFSTVVILSSVEVLVKFSRLFSFSQAILLLSISLKCAVFCVGSFRALSHKFNGARALIAWSFGGAY
jgi:hypothetical protein